MSTSPAETSDELPQDLLFLLTPAFDIYHRIEPEEFIAYVLQVDRLIDNEFRHQPDGEGVEIQVACALLPCSRKLIEVQIHPPDAASAETTRVSLAIDRIPSPEVTGGPVAFFRRGVFGGNPPPGSELELPFLRFVPSPGMVLLDDVLMHAGGVLSATRSLWDRLRTFFRPEEPPIRSIVEQDIVPRLSRESGRPVIVCNGRMGVGS